MQQFSGREVHVAMKACTGWLFVARALEDAGAIAHLAETVETRALRGRKRRAKTDRQDALWLRELLAEGRLPEAWIALEHVCQWRSRLHLRKALIDQRTQWLLRVRSVLYHHRLSAGAPGEIAGAGGRQSLARLGLPADARERVTVALDMIDTLEREISEIKRSRRRVARHQAGCQALMTQFDVGELIALTLVTELGDVTRMSSSRKRSASPGSTSACTALTRPRASANSPAKAPRHCAGRCMRPRSQPPGHGAPTTPTTTPSKPEG